MNNNDQIEALQEGITIAVRSGLVHALFPLARNTKRPVYEEWQQRPPYTEAKLRMLVMSYDLGLRTGAFSSVLVVDDDQPKHGKDGKAEHPNVPEADRYELPPSSFRIMSPLGSEHRYYTHVPGVGNNAGFIAPHVDHRGSGGYVVWIGSGHPFSENLYKLIEDGPITTASVELIKKLSTKPAPKKRSVELSGEVSRYARAAFSRELATVANSPEGTRNDTLNRAAFNLGQLVGGGALDEAEVVDALCACFPGEKKAADTVQRGVIAGIKEPRGVPVTPTVGRVTIKSEVPDHFRSDVLIPGTHSLFDEDQDEANAEVSRKINAGEDVPRDQLAKSPVRYGEQPSDHFCEDVLKNIPGSLLYLRGGAVGEISDDSFVVVDSPRAQALIDSGVRLIKGKIKKPSEAVPLPKPYTQFVPCTGPLAALVLGSARVSSHLREIIAISPFPVFYGEDAKPARPGWNGDCGIYLTCDHVPRSLPIEPARDLLEELVCDFPWVSPVDRTNYFGLLLTPIVRHAIRGVVPMHLIEAPDVAAGKTLLASGVLGGILNGAAVAAGSLGRNEEEREKRILGMLLQGKAIVNFDNVSDTLDSEALTKLITGETYEGRILGKTGNVEIENRMTVIATGNNVSHNVDMGRRIVKIRLQPAPEGLCFRHDPLGLWIEENRERLLGALLGLVDHWKRQGQPRGGRYPSFESWAGVVGGILGAAGWTDHREGAAELQVAGDTFEGEIEAFIGLWLETFGNDPVSKEKLMELAKENHLLDNCFVAPTDHGNRVLFGTKVLSRIVGRRTKGGIIYKGGRGSATRLWIL